MSKPNVLSPSFMTRRQFLYRSALAAAGSAALTSFASSRPRKLGPTDKLRIACIGAGGKGRSDIQHCSKEEIVALCDADASRAGNALKTLPNAKFYADWRQLLDKEEKNID